MRRLGTALAATLGYTRAALWEITHDEATALTLSVDVSQRAWVVVAQP